jgi:hypothetical protein
MWDSPGDWAATTGQGTCGSVRQTFRGRVVDDGRGQLDVGRPAASVEQIDPYSDQKAPIIALFCSGASRRRWHTGTVPLMPLSSRGASDLGSEAGLISTASALVRPGGRTRRRGGRAGRIGGLCEGG